jgi:hypothetical protein
MAIDCVKFTLANLSDRLAPYGRKKEKNCTKAESKTSGASIATHIFADNLHFHFTSSSSKLCCRALSRSELDREACLVSLWGVWCIHIVLCSLDLDQIFLHDQYLIAKCIHFHNKHF